MCDYNRVLQCSIFLNHLSDRLNLQLEVGERDDWFESTHPVVPAHETSYSSYRLRRRRPVRQSGDVYVIGLARHWSYSLKDRPSIVGNSVVPDGTTEQPISYRLTALSLALMASFNRSRHFDK